MIARRPWTLVAVCILLIACALGAGQVPRPQNAGPGPAFHWPEGKRGALSLSFDDARPSQIDNGLPLFERYGVKVTFYVSPDRMKERLAGWKQAAASGHEIGNHTLSHICSGNDPYFRPKALENLTLDQVREEMVAANKVIKDELGVTPKTFAYPCGKKFVGRGRNVQSYVPLVAELFDVGRGWLDEDPNDPLFCDMAQVLSVPSDRQDFDRIKPQIDRALRRGFWIVFSGHEIASVDRNLTTRISMLEDLLRYVQDPANGVWIDTIQNVASYIEKQRGSALPAPAAVAQEALDWTVVSAGKVDARIQHQLEGLAAEHHARGIQFSQGPKQPAASGLLSGSLYLELNEEPSAKALLAKLSEEASGAGVKPTIDLAKEGFTLDVSYAAPSIPGQIRITAASPAGFHCALLRLAALLIADPARLETDLVPRPQALRRQSNGGEVIIADYPSFPIRGVVEGFYGQPWTHEQRLAMLRFEGRNALNVFYYGPKDEPYHRSLWRDPYPPEEMKRFGELAEAARENFVTFNFAISPGLSMTYSSDAEFQKLTAKLDGFWKLGIRDFSLFLDDVQQDLVHEADRRQFKTLSAAHVYLTNKLYQHLKSLSPQATLMVCPTTYTNEWGNRDYIKDLGAGVNPDVPLAWTGTRVGSPEITVAQAREWGGYIRRKPVVWDNPPGGMNPLRGREAGLASELVGLFSNPPHAVFQSFIHLQTVADYLWNPVAYDPEKSRNHAFVSQYGKDAPEILAPLLKMFGSGRGVSRSLSSAQRGTPIDIPAVREQISQMTAVLNSLREEKRFEGLVAELSATPDSLRKRMASLLAHPGFRHLPDGKIQLDENYDMLKASRLESPPAMDGDFQKWQSMPLYVLSDRSQIAGGANLWKGPEQLSARVALAWDEEHLYVGVEITNPQLFQPYFGRGIQNGDAFRLFIDTVLPGAPPRQGRTTTGYDLYLSPGNFAKVKPSIFSMEDFLPPRPRPHDLGKEIKAVWKKTANGYSGDIAIPISFLEGQKLVAGREIPLSFAVQKSSPPQNASEEQEPKQILFTSKKDPLFRINGENPGTFQHLVLTDTVKPK